MQPPKSILFHLGSPKCMAEHIRHMSIIADAFDARVTAQACRTSMELRYSHITEYAVDAAAILEQMSRHERDRWYEAFIQNAAGAPRLSWAEPIEDGLRGFARCALIQGIVRLVLPQNQQIGVEERPGSFIASLLVQSGRPALVLQYAGSWPAIGQSVLIAWKETPEAARTVSAISYGSEAKESLSELRDSLHVRGVASVALHAESVEGPDACNSLTVPVLMTH